MASKVLVPAAPFAKLQVKKSPPDAAGPGFIIGADPAARVSHLEHSVRFLQEQHRLMLSGLHAEIEALRERNRDLQFQLIFKQESAPTPPPPKPTSPVKETAENTEVTKLKSEVVRLEREAVRLEQETSRLEQETVHLERETSRLDREASSAQSEARAAEARALQLQKLVDEQAEKIRHLEITPKLVKCPTCVEPQPAEPEPVAPPEADEDGTAESRAELRARLADAERLVRRLRAEAERRRRELQCMKNSLHASLRATGLDGFGYQNNYHFPPVHTPDFWREPIREDYGMAGRGRSTRRPLTLPELGQPLGRSTVYANNHTRPRANGYENKNKRQQSTNGEVSNGKSPEEPQECRLSPNYLHVLPNLYDTAAPVATYPELKIVVTKIIPHGNVNGQSVEAARARPRRQHRKHAPDHT